MASGEEGFLPALSDLQSQSLSIIRLSEPIFNPPSSNNHPRASDISTSGSTSDTTHPTPASLAADLSHYRDLFSKLRFSYLEQVTKEKFLRAIVGDPPLIIENAENVELESQLREVKAVLKEQKEHVANMVQELERKGRDLARRYEQVGLQTVKLERLPGQINTLDEAVRSLREQNKEVEDEVGGNQGIEGILELTRQRERQREEVEWELKALQREIPGKGRELETLRDELKRLGREKEKAVEGAREAVKSRKNGGEVGDDLEMKGRWLKGCEEGLKGLLGVEV
ncbi:MAG: hypothetical protein LQ346_000385 [Caloplaca aetnensis]|nr:MAG: hypothetical protein LQ346_000385 [Caloplaca aetnensis]